MSLRMALFNLLVMQLHGHELVISAMSCREKDYLVKVINTKSISSY